MVHCTSMKNHFAKKICKDDFGFLQNYLENITWKKDVSLLLLLSLAELLLEFRNIYMNAFYKKDCCKEGYLRTAHVRLQTSQWRWEAQCHVSISQIPLLIPDVVVILILSHSIKPKQSCPGVTVQSSFAGPLRHGESCVKDWFILLTTCATQRETLALCWTAALPAWLHD